MLLDTPLCNFGWKAPEFTLKDFNAKEFTMSENLGKKGLLIMFICNHCPYVQRIAKELSRDTKLLMDEGVHVLAVMSNDYKKVEEDSPQNMKIFAEENDFKFPYLVDEDQSVGKMYDAVCTPDFFGFNSKGELQYRGRIQEDELLKAMRQIAKTGHGPKEQTPSMGCSIKWRE